MNALISKIECIIKFLTETNSRIFADVFNASGKQFHNVVGYLDCTHIKVEILVVKILVVKILVVKLILQLQDISFITLACCFSRGS